MTAEQFHDALSLLPADLLAEADTIRNQPTRILPWKRYAAMAACFVLVLGSAILAGSLLAPEAKESAQITVEESLLFLPEDAREEAPAEVQNQNTSDSLSATAEDAENQTNTTCAAGTLPLHPGITIAHHIQAGSPAAACYSSTASCKLFRSREALETYREGSLWLRQEELIQACETYDQNWFLHHDLLLVNLLDVPEDADAQITAIREENGQWQIFFSRGADSSAQTRQNHHFLLALEKDLIPESGTILLLAE